MTDSVWGPRDLPCLACGVVGREGRDVMFKVVEVPEAERRMVSVLVDVHHAVGSLQMPELVPERYAAEPRCRDTRACAERVRAFSVVPPAAGEKSAEPDRDAEPPDELAPSRPRAEPEPEYVL